MSDEQSPEVSTQANPPGKPAGNGWRTFGIIVISVATTLGAGYWYVTHYLFPDQFKPVELSQSDSRRLDRKLEKLGGDAAAGRQEPLEPEPYSEAGASREVEFTEQELNALLARNTDLASRLAIDLSENLASARLLVDMPPDFPVLGGKTVNVSAGMELRLVDGRPSAVLKGISVWGIPLPNAWLGNMKNIDLLQEFGRDGGFWQVIRDGVEEISVHEGKLRIRFKE